MSEDKVEAAISSVIFLLKRMVDDRIYRDQVKGNNLGAIKCLQVDIARLVKRMGYE